jgi:hypothetical protein
MLSIIGMIGFAILGIAALITGKITLSKNKVVLGTPARLLGLLALTPLPIVLVIGVAYAVASGPADPEKFQKDNQLVFAAIEIGTLVVVGAVVFGIGAALAVSPEEVRRKKRKRRRDVDDEYEEEERPRKRSRRDEEEQDEHEEEDRPRKRSRREDEYEEEERPRKRSRQYDDEDEDDRDRRGRYR